MPVELRNIPGRPAPTGYNHVSIATGDRVIHLAGQVGTGEDGELVSGGLGAQTTQALLNLGAALDAAGATEADLVKLTIYVTDWDPSQYEELGGGILAAREQRPCPDVPITMIGVASLFTPDMRVEVEGVAVSSG